MADPDPVLDHPLKAMHIPGWMTPAELLWLGRQAAKMESIAEIGSLQGRSSFMLLSNCRGPVYCIDPWDYGNEWINEFTKNCGHFSNLNIVREYSPQAVSSVPDVDMTFIDGNHERKSVEADIEAWLPKTRKLLCGHDYAPNFPGVVEAVDAAFGEIYNPFSTSIWAVEIGPKEKPRTTSGAST